MSSVDKETAFKLWGKKNDRAALLQGYNEANLLHWLVHWLLVLSAKSYLGVSQSLF